MQWSGDIHRASAVQYNAGQTTEEPLYTFQNPDTDRKVVGTYLQCSGKPGELGDGHQVSELSFDATLTVDPSVNGEVADDTRSSILHYAGVNSNGDTQIAVGDDGRFIPQSAEWRRGTELFIHGNSTYDADSAVRAVVYYKEE